MQAEGFGDALRSWRQLRRLSQLQLAVDSGVSARHLSFMENGHAQPSREMVLRLAAELRLPLREQNRMLLSAGFAPVFEERPLEAEALSAIKAAAALVLERHEPYCAVALDRQRNIVLANRPARRLAEGLSQEVLGPPLNIYRMLLHPGGLAPRIVDFEAYSGHLLGRLGREAASTGDPVLEALFQEVKAYPGVGAPELATPASAPALVLRLRDGEGELAFVTTIATFGTPFDITVAELVIECLFPANDATANKLI